MNYTDKIHEVMMRAGHPERDLLALVQEAVRDAADEVRKAHSAEVLAHIETKKELQVYKTLAAQSVNGGWPAALVQRCAELEAEVTGLKDNWSNERDMLKTAWDRESAVGRRLREEIGRLRDRAEKKLEASLRAQEKLEKKIAGFREVLSPFKHLLEDL